MQNYTSSENRKQTTTLLIFSHINGDNASSDKIPWLKGANITRTRNTIKIVFGNYIRSS